MNTIFKFVQAGVTWFRPSRVSAVGLYVAHEGTSFKSISVEPSARTFIAQLMRDPERVGCEVVWVRHNGRSRPCIHITSPYQFLKRYSSINVSSHPGPRSNEGDLDHEAPVKVEG